jgi:hypothetical protein
MNPGLNQTLEQFGAPGKHQSLPGLHSALTNSWVPHVRSILNPRNHIQTQISTSPSPRLSCLSSSPCPPSHEATLPIQPRYRPSPAPYPHHLTC